MRNYFFVKKNNVTSYYNFQDKYCDAVPINIFTYPYKPVPLTVQCLSEFDYNVPDILLSPSLALNKQIFNSLTLTNIYGVNWVEIILIDKGEHLYYMLQVCNEIKAIDRGNSDFDFYEIDENDSEDEFISGMRQLIIDESKLTIIPLKKRIIFRDPAWLDEVFFHESIVNEIMLHNPSGVEFISVDGYSEFV